MERAPRASTDYFAQAERLANWACVSLGADRPTLLQILGDWCERYQVPLSAAACESIITHVLTWQTLRAQLVAA